MGKRDSCYGEGSIYSERINPTSQFGVSLGGAGLVTGTGPRSKSWFNSGVEVLTAAKRREELTVLWWI